MELLFGLFVVYLVFSFFVAVMSKIGEFLSRISNREQSEILDGESAEGKSQTTFPKTVS